MIEFKGVTYRAAKSVKTAAYENIDILCDIDIRISKGRFVSIIGKNGSGKTTFGMLIKGLLAPTSGEVIVDAEVNRGVNDKVGYIFTNPENQIVHPLVEDDIAFGLENQMAAESEMRQRVVAALKEVSMEAHLKSPIHWLSRGEQQKIVAAGVITLNSEVIVFDEAASLLDGKAKDELMRIVLKLNKVDEKTIIYITHDLRDVIFTDDVILLESGSIAFNGSKEAFFKDTDMQEKYKYELPDVVKLVNYFRGKGFELGYCDTPALIEKINAILKQRQRSL